MKKKSCFKGSLSAKGFTLIELLVVVLIIGILAAVALPQYKVAVAKARMTQLVTLANSVAQAEERYYLANNEYTTDWTALDIELDGTITNNATTRSTLTNSAGWIIKLSSYIAGVSTEEVTAQDTRLPGVLISFVFDNGSREDMRGKRYCNAVRTDALANIVCKNATHKSSPDGYPTDMYRYYF